EIHPSGPLRGTRAADRCAPRRAAAPGARPRRPRVRGRRRTRGGAHARSPGGRHWRPGAPGPDGGRARYPHRVRGAHPDDGHPGGRAGDGPFRAHGDSRPCVAARAHLLRRAEPQRADERQRVPVPGVRRDDRDDGRQPAPGRGGGAEARHRRGPDARTAPAHRGAVHHRGHAADGCLPRRGLSRGGAPVRGRVGREGRH
ncbi:MAG: hypothetical protein AVDCRST_MAG89-813, partial [uncultured Gemmatimonadetes bacterium]